MQVNLNTQNNKQNFGMAIRSNENVDKVLRSRIKTSAMLEMLDDIISSQAKNDKVHITLRVNPDKRTLLANVFTDDLKNYFCKQYSESFLGSLFGDPLKFIKKVAEVADKEAVRLKSANLDYDKVFSKMKKD